MAPIIRLTILNLTGISLALSALTFCPTALSAPLAESDTNPTALPPDGETAPQYAIVNLKMQVPQMYKSTTELKAYPYTTKPMKMVTPLVPLPLERKPIRELILTSGYASRSSSERPYPDGGWRWSYAFHNALKRSHTTMPKSMVGLYSWVDKMIGYALPECERINAIEEKREKRYFQLVQDYEDNHKDEEMEALRRGQEVTPIRLRRFNRDGKLSYYTSQVRLIPGEWWITGTHKVPGLIYYWQYPLTVKAGQTYNLSIDDANAALIVGGY